MEYGHPDSPSLRFVTLAIVLFFITSTAVAQDHIAAVDAFLKAEMEEQKIPGVSLAVVRDGKPLIVKGYGFANVEHQVPVKPETIFQSGSVGKQFTAMAVMMLVEEGKIGLDDKISKHLGEVPEAWAHVTVRHLLTHTGGLTDYPREFDFRKDYTRGRPAEAGEGGADRVRTGRKVGIQQSRFRYFRDHRA